MNAPLTSRSPSRRARLLSSIPSATTCLVLATPLVFPTSATAQDFVDVTATSGLQTATKATVAYSDGICCGDFDGDGDLDVIATGAVDSPIQYYRNDGDMQFHEINGTSLGFSPARGNHAANAVDVDNDGDLDVYLGNIEAPVQLYINDGTGHFVDEAALRGLTHISTNWAGAFGDYDGDGWLDLYVGNRNGSSLAESADLLYRNTGDGYFVDVTAASGMGSTRLTLVATFVDYNEDLLPDVFVGMDKGTSFGGNQLFENQGDGTFVEVATQRNCDNEIDAMGVDFVDVFNDGGMDFYASDSPPDHVFNIWNPQSQAYEDRVYEFDAPGFGVGWAVQFADFDNDGWQDVHVVHGTAPNTIYQNPAAPGAWNAIDYGFESPSQTSAVVADFDNDGRLDILNRIRGTDLQGSDPGGLALLRNVTASQLGWLQVDCVGTRSNRDGYGARVEVYTDSSTPQRQYVRNSAGFQASNPKTLHFGLRNNATARLRVRWPSGQVQEIRPVAANQRIRLIEPSMTMQGVPRPGSICRLRFESPLDLGTHYAIFLSASDDPRTPLGDGRELAVTFDDLSVASLLPANGVLLGNVAELHRNAGEATLVIPNDVSLVGLTVFATGLTYIPGGPLATILSHAAEIVVQP